MDIELTIGWVSDTAWPPGHHLAGTLAAYPALWVVQTGSVLLEMAGQAFRLSPGQAVLMPAGIPRAISTPQGCRFYSLGIRVLLCGAVCLFEDFPLPVCWTLPPETGTLLAQLLACMVVDQGATTPATRLCLDGLARAVIGLCWTALAGAEMRRHIPEWWVQVTRAVQAAPHCSVTELAARVDYSPAQLRRLFQQYRGLSPQQYLHQHRLATAQRLLIATTLSISAIAEHLGFASVSHFSRTFKTHFGLPPLTYRQSWRTGAV